MRLCRPLRSLMVFPRHRRLLEEGSSSNSSHRFLVAHSKGAITLRAQRKWHAATPHNYATRAYFCRIFQQDIHSLYLLAFLLTGNHVGAEQCFFAGMEDALNENTVFKEWAHSWSRRVVITNAIRTIAPLSAQSHTQPGRWATADEESEACTTISAVAQLASLDRIIFVMSVLERYSVPECATLLDCSARDVQRGRIRALQQLPALYPALLSSSSEDHHCAAERLQREYQRSRT